MTPIPFPNTRLDELVANPPEGSVVLDITPEMARYLLQTYGSHNRREKPAAILRYQRDMESGAWVCNGETVKLTDRHRLGDGQHRLRACIRAGKPFRTHLVFGIPDEYFPTLDQGRNRNPDDLLFLDGVIASGHISRAVRWAELLATVKNDKLPRTTYTPPEILRMWRERYREAGLHDWLPEARAIGKRHNQPVGMVMALLHRFDGIDSDFTVDFAEAWAAGDFQPPFMPIRRLQALLEKLGKYGTGRIRDDVRAAMIVNTWNACRKRLRGERGTIDWDISKDFPDPL